jgi:hypothetical protein
VVDAPIHGAGLERFLEPQIVSNGETLFLLWTTAHTLDVDDTGAVAWMKPFVADGAYYVSPSVC